MQVKYALNWKIFVLLLCNICQRFQGVFNTRSTTSYVVRKISGTDIPDTTSGFRAYSREAAMNINIVSAFTYTLETIIAAGTNGIIIKCIPIEVNDTRRPSRLFKGNWQYVKQSIVTIIRIYTMYRPLKVFFYIGSFYFWLGMFVSFRYLYYYAIGEGGGHVQSVILAGVFLLIGFIMFMIGLLADVISANRKLHENTLFRLKKIDYSQNKDNLDTAIENTRYEILSKRASN
jgi:hypothetical protein